MGNARRNRFTRCFHPWGRAIVLTGFLVILLVGARPPEVLGQEQTVRLSAVADTWVNAGFNTVYNNKGQRVTVRQMNYGDNPGLSIVRGRYSGGNEFLYWQASLIRFEIPPSIGTEVERATLHLYHYTSWQEHVAAYRMNKDWKEMEATFDQPSKSAPLWSSGWSPGGNFAGVPTDSVFVYPAAGWYALDVTGDVKAFLGGTQNYGWFLRSSDTGSTDTTSTAFYSKEARNGLEPYLEIVYEKVEPWTGVKQFGTTAPDSGISIALDEKGNVYVVGYTEGNFDGYANLGGFDAFLVQYDASGNRRWIRQVGSADTDVHYEVTVDKNGDVIVVGTTSGAPVQPCVVGNVTLAKYDVEGNEIWTSRYDGGACVDAGYSVAVDSSRSIYITGYTYVNPQQFDVILVKFDRDGNFLWNRQFGGGGYSIGSGVAVDGSGDVYVTGQTGGPLDGQSHAGDYDMFLVKYHSSGNRIWTRLLGSDGSEAGFSVAVDGNGNSYVAGYTDRALEGNTHFGSGDWFIACYDASGNKLWTRQFGTGGDDYAGSIALQGSNVYMTGTAYANDGLAEAYVFKYDTQGNQQWTRELRTEEGAYGNGIAVDKKGFVFVTGMVEGSLEGATPVGAEDAFVAKFSSDGVLQ